MEMEKLPKLKNTTGLTVSSCITLTFPKNQWCL